MSFSGGTCRGTGGSMHIYDIENNFQGGWALVAEQLPYAIGEVPRSGPRVCVFGHLPNTTVPSMVMSPNTSPSFYQSPDPTRGRSALHPAGHASGHGGGGRPHHCGVRGRGRRAERPHGRVPQRRRQGMGTRSAALTKFYLITSRVSNEHCFHLGLALS